MNLKCVSYFVILSKELSVYFTTISFFRVFKETRIKSSFSILLHFVTFSMYIYNHLILSQDIQIHLDTSLWIQGNWI